MGGGGARPRRARGDQDAGDGGRPPRATRDADHGGGEVSTRALEHGQWRWAPCGPGEPDDAEGDSGKVRRHHPSGSGRRSISKRQRETQTGLVYIPSKLCRTWRPQSRHLLPRVFEFDLGKSGPGGYMSELIAWDPVKQQKVWGNKDALPWLGGTMTTAGGLVFHGDVRGMFKALDAKTGSSSGSSTRARASAPRPSPTSSTASSTWRWCRGAPSRSRSSSARSASRWWTRAPRAAPCSCSSSIAVGPGGSARCRRERSRFSARWCSGSRRAAG